MALEAIFRVTEAMWPYVYKHFIDDKNVHYVYILGESTSQGVQYSEKLNPAMMAVHSLGGKIQGRNVQFINLALSGHEINYHYFTFYFELLFRPHTKGTVFIYSGINECYLRDGAPADGLWALVQKSIVASKLCYVFGFFENSPDRFRFRYSQICQLAKRNEYKILASQIVGNITGYDPEVQDGDPLFSLSNADLFNQMRQNMLRRNYQLALNNCNVLQHKVHALNAYLSYSKGKCYYQMDIPDSAEYYFSEATENHFYIGYSAWKNKIIEQVCKEEAAELVKTYDVFSDSSDHKLIGYNLINDAHHPNLKGYCLMANEVAKCLSAVYGLDIVKPINSENVSQDFELDSAFYAGVYFKLAEWFLFEVFETKVRENRIDRLRLYIQTYRSIAPNDKSPFLWEILLAIAENNPREFIKCARLIHETNREKEFLGRFQNTFNSARFWEVRVTLSNWTFEHNEDEKLRKVWLSNL